MRFESIKAEICKSSLVKLNQVQCVRKEVEKRYKLFSELKSDLNNREDKVEEILQTCRNDLRLLEKLERKATNYKKIIIEKYGDYDSSITRIIFPKGSKKKFKTQWLLKNDYPIKSRYYHINSMYDCTGQVCRVYVTNKANLVEIESFYDI